VRAKATLQGVAGARWLRDLGQAIEGLERDWGVVVGAALGGGSDSYVAEARTEDGEDAVAGPRSPARPRRCAPPLGAAGTPGCSTTTRLVGPC
jgi:hypothetical protein